MFHLEQGAVLTVLRSDEGLSVTQIPDFLRDNQLLVYGLYGSNPEYVIITSLHSTILSPPRPRYESPWRLIPGFSLDPDCKQTISTRLNDNRMQPRARLFSAFWLRCRRLIRQTVFGLRPWKISFTRHQPDGLSEHC